MAHSGEKSMTVWRCLTFVACLNFSTLLYAGEDGLPFTENDGCMQGPLAQFGKYLGDHRGTRLLAYSRKTG